MFVPLGWDLLNVTHMVPKILKWLPHFLKICAVLHNIKHLKIITSG